MKQFNVRECTPQKGYALKADTTLGNFVAADILDCMASPVFGTRILLYGAALDQQVTDLITEIDCLDWPFPGNEVYHVDLLDEFRRTFVKRPGSHIRMDVEECTENSPVVYRDVIPEVSRIDGDELTGLSSVYDTGRPRTFPYLSVEYCCDSRGEEDPRPSYAMIVHPVFFAVGKKRGYVNAAFMLSREALECIFERFIEPYKKRNCSVLKEALLVQSENKEDIDITPMIVKGRCIRTVSGPHIS